MNRSTTKPGFQGGYALFWGQHFKIHGTTGFGQFLGFANFDPPQPWKTPAYPQHLTPQDRSPKQWLRGRLAHLTPDDDRKSVLKAINEEIDKIPKSNEWTEQDTAG